MKCEIIACYTCIYEAWGVVPQCRLHPKRDVEENSKGCYDWERDWFFDD